MGTSLRGNTGRCFGAVREGLHGGRVRGVCRSGLGYGVGGGLRREGHAFGWVGLGVGPALGVVGRHWWLKGQLG